jgi:hypothetical protein
MRKSSGEGKKTGKWKIKGIGSGKTTLPERK